jgi:hypothetical protein
MAMAMAMAMAMGMGMGEGEPRRREDAKVFGIWGSTNPANFTKRYFGCPFE